MFPPAAQDAGASEASVFEVLVFGDSTDNVIPDLTSLLFQHNTFIDGFFDEAYQAIRAELSQLSPVDRAAYSSFSNLKELVALHRDGRCPVSLHQALTVTGQLGLFISRHTTEHTNWSEGNVATLGICTGSLSAAVISSSNSLQSLFENAVRAVAVATRLGLLTTRISYALQGSSQGRKPWAFLVPGASAIDVSARIDEFVRSKGTPLLSRPYISSYAPNGVTVSGPSETLASLRGSSTFFQSKSRDVGLLTAYHAPHLYSEADIEWVLSTSTAGDWNSHSGNIPVISSVSGKLIWTGAFRPLLVAALKACLMQPLRLDLVNSEIAATMRVQGASRVDLVAFVSLAAQILQNSLRSLDKSVSLKSWSASNTGTSKTASAIETRDKIAIVGMSGRFPEAENINEFWDLLSQGLDVCQEAPPTRWDVKTHVDVTGKAKNTSAVPWGCWLQNAGLYDPRFFGISPKEAAQCDPQQRLATMAAYEAMEEAGLVVGRTPSTQKERVGVFLGSTGCDWFETNTPQDISTFFISGGNRAFAPGRVNYVFNLCGPSYSVDTACSSSLAATHLACNAIWRGDCDTAITGGTNMCTNPDAHAGLDRGFFLSRTGNCKTFDDGADGYCRGEAAGVVILKRLEDAIADKDPIRGVILGINTNHSAESEAIVRPHAGAQSFLMRKVLDNAGVNPHDISYVEMHGTGTQAGDAIEMQSVLETMANVEGPKRDGQHGLHLGSVKSNIGHGEAASGASSLIKVLLMMEHDKIPPHCGIKTKINHNFPLDLEDRQVRIARELTRWQRPAAGKRRVLINNFSAAGGNTALLLEDAPEISVSDIEDDRSSYVVTASAKCAFSLTSNLKGLIKFIESKDENDKLVLPRLSYTTTVRRDHYPFRAAVSGSSMDEIRLALEKAVENETGKTRAIKLPSVLMVFTGQGAQYGGMGRQLYKSFASFRATIQNFSQLAQQNGFPGFVDVFAEDQVNIDSLEPIVVQLATVALEVASARLLEKFGIFASAVVGHSLGEYAALNVAKVLSDSEMIYLVGIRAQLLQTHCGRGTHSMLAVKASMDTVESILKSEQVNIACINGPEATVLAGTNEQTKKWQEVLSDSKIKGKVLNTAYAFHSSQADPILQDLDHAAAGIELRSPSVPVICPLTSKVILDAADFGQGYFARHCRQPVNMLGALSAAQKMQVVTAQTIVIEVGPQPVVTGMVKTTLDLNIRAHHIVARGCDSHALLTDLLSAFYSAGVDVKWPELHVDHLSAQKVLKLPAYGWDLKNYWMQYTGDWSLRKGMSIADTVATYGNSSGKSVDSCNRQLQTKQSGTTQASLPVPMKPVQQRPRPTIECTTVHRILEEVSDENSAKIVVEADVTRDDLYPISQGHKVNGVPLCTPSVYAEIGQNVGKYLVDLCRPDQSERLVDISKLVVEKPLIPVAKSKGPQLVRCSAKIDWLTKTGECMFYGVDEQGKTHTEYAWCTIMYKNNSRLDILQSKVPEVKARMKDLVDGVAIGTSARFSSAAAYKMVGTLASFHPDFRGVYENILDSKSLEIVATLKFDKIKKAGKFITHPAAIDALTQPGGFVMNAKDSTDLELEVYVNHGWDSFQIYEPISLDKTYQVYTQMKSRQGTLWAGDNYVFESGRLVAFFEGITLRKMPRKAFHMILNWTTSQDASKPSGPVSTASGATKPVIKSDHAPAARPASSPVIKDEMQTKTLPPVKQPIVETVARQSVQESPEPSKVKQAMEMIAEESGIAMDALTDDSAFADIGIDSLLSMVIAGRFREELDLDFNEEMTIFIDFPTVGALRRYLSSLEVPASSNAQSIRIDDNDMVAEKVMQEEAASKVPQEVVPMKEEKAAVLSQPLSAPAPPKQAKPQEQPQAIPVFDKAMEMIAEESGIAVEDLTLPTSFADVGIDSLLSMVIASRFKEELGVDLDDEMSIFIDFPTVGDLKRHFASKQGVVEMEEGVNSETLFTPEASPPDRSLNNSPAQSDSSSERSSDGEESSSSASSVDEEELTPPPKQNSGTFCKPTTSVILQGRPAVSKKTLFLFPDGGGSASSYIALPRLGQDIAVIGLNCPYARDPENMQCSIEPLIESFVNEVKRRQPEGPYHLGGWSSGGVFAFVATQLLVARGEIVESLVIIDSPTPNTMDALPTDFFDWAEQLRNTDKAPVPAYLTQHFKATTDVMVGYKAKPIQALGVKSPDVLILWATKGLMSGKTITRYQLPKGVPADGLSFLLDDKIDLGPKGWDKLLPSSAITILPIEGANHFTLMSNRPDNKKFVAQASKAISALLT